MKLQHIQYAITVAEEKSISRAAEKLYISQPGLSKSIHELEKDLGITIFQRSRKGVQVTPSGQEFIGFTKQIMRQSEFLQEHFSADNNRKIRLSVSSQHYLIASMAFTELVKKYKDTNYELELNETDTYSIISNVSQYQSELGILFLDKENEYYLGKLFKNSGLVFEKLFSSGIFVNIHQTHPLAGLDEITLDDLNPYPRIILNQGAHNEPFFSELPLPFFKHNKILKLSNLSTALRCMAELDACAIGIDPAAGNELGPDYVIRPVQIDHVMMVGYIRREKEELSPLAQEYLRQFRDLIKQ